jgi:hypothetical protein
MQPRRSKPELIRALAAQLNAWTLCCSNSQPCPACASTRMQATCTHNSVMQAPWLAATSSMHLCHHTCRCVLQQLLLCYACCPTLCNACSPPCSNRLLENASGLSLRSFSRTELSSWYYARDPKQQRACLLLLLFIRWQLAAARWWVAATCRGGRTSSLLLLMAGTATAAVATQFGFVCWSALARSTACCWVAQPEH